MRFKTKFDRWIVIVLTLTSVLTCIVLPLIRLLVPGSQPVPLPAVFLPVVIWLIVLPNTLPQYYDLREDGLFIRQGWRKSLIPYSSIAEVQSMTDTRSAAVFSADRIHIVTQNGKRFIIAVAEEERFFDELAKRCTQLDRKPFGLGTPFSVPSDV
ncbi:MAG TPA: PH domain-containing protein [Bryobacteraceae bacterium]|nr:PH domain-containing protein [Bryobacteraceae bacterium]